jgi:hypothetical protein
MRAATLALLLLAAGCASHQPVSATQPAAVRSPAPGQLTFESPDAAADALVAAAKSQDRDALRRIFGPDLPSLTSGDPQQDAHDFTSFAAHASDRTRVVQTSSDAATLLIGDKEWPLPIPLVRAASDGRWYFDTPAGRSVILARRIGGNELNTIAVCRAYVAAQRQYASEFHDGGDVHQYAQRLTSRSGKHDGLYWPAATSDADGPSPFGPLVQQAAAEGYAPPKGAARAPFHGYYFRVLKSQGPHAPGGAYSYVINGHMIAGFALVAYPAQYGNTGVMTFLVSHHGIVYQKDLGPNTASLAPQITAYDPDPSWSPVQD